jgi:hypothetical protein
MENRKGGDPFDPAKLRIPPEIITNGRAREEAQKAPRARKAEAAEFIMVPLSRHLQLAGAPGSVVWLAYHLHYLSWKAHGRPFKLGNVALGRNSRMTRHSKLRALRDLERRGWIKVQMEPRKSPLITVVADGGKTANL